MNRTKIEWVKNPDGTQGYTWNPITGCLNGCEYCYAKKLANGRLRTRYLANKSITPYAGRWNADDDPFFPRAWFDRREPALESKKPKGIFVCDMSDLFGIHIPFDWTQHVINLIRLSPQHRFYLLTKQPQNLIKFSPFPDNCWVGVTATDAKSFLEAGRGLEKIEARTKYISFEPLLGYIGGLWLEDWLKSGVGINWVIIGAQTKPYKSPKIEWIQEIVDACDKAGIPVFLKDNLCPMFAENDCKLFKEHRDTLFTFKDFEPDSKTRWHLRQEMPKIPN